MVILLLLWEWRLLLEIIIWSVLVVIHLLVIRELVGILTHLTATVFHFDIVEFVLEDSALVRAVSPDTMPLIILHNPSLLLNFCYSCRLCEST